MNAQVPEPPVTAASGPRPPGVYALLADGSTVEIRPAAGSDFDAVLEHLVSAARGGVSRTA